MISQYKNIDQINSANKSVSATRLDKSVTEFLSYSANNRFTRIPAISNQEDSSCVELHVYSGGVWQTGNHKIQLQTKHPEYVDKTSGRPITFPAEPIAINLYDEFNKLKLTAGNFKIAVNFFKNLIGSYDQQHLRIDEISPDRTEIRLRAIDDTNPAFLAQITDYINTVRHTSSSFYKTYLLNFSRNQTALVVNSVVIGEYVYVKLYEPLADIFDINFKCWVVEELKPAYIDNVAFVLAAALSKSYKLANPNWNANAIHNVSSETSMKTWHDLLGSSVQTSQQIVDTYFSGSLSGVTLNVDYSDFNNFIFYSSATERLENFKYKLELLEYYTSQSLVVAQLSGSVATTNVADYASSKTSLISGFDSFEKYLYYQSSSILSTNPIPHESPIVAQVTGSYISPIPKTNSTVPYTLANTTSNQFKTWYQNVYDSASLYDTLNYNALVYAIPEFIRYDTMNDGITTFANMLGHHYDILYTYISNMSRINNREENPKLGMPNELLYSVAKQFGWHLTEGNQYQDLWQYVLGTNETGIPLTGSNTVGEPSVPGRDMTYAVWRRIVNNLPLLLKSKGTKRSVQALLSCYGIPQSMISINEYGGPRLDRAPVYEKLNFDYALDLINSPAGIVVIPYSSPTAIELRFKTDNIIANPFMSSPVNLFKWNSGTRSVKLNYVSGTKGTVCIQSGGTTGVVSSPIEMFDGNGWLTAVLQEVGANLKVTVTRAKHGKIVAQTTASFNSLGIDGSNMYLGSATSPTTYGYRFQGYLQELKIWNTTLDSVYINNHTTAPSSYNSPDPYNDLAFRLPLTQKINHTLTSSLTGVQPKLSTITASFAGWSSATPYDSIEETYYYDAPSLGMGTFDDNKIRLEDNDLVGTLDVKTRAERSQFDKAPLDSKRLGIYFSPQTMIDEDIIAQLGSTELDQYIGDPGNNESRSYPRLIQAAQNYWKKYSTSNDFNAYINMFTLFDLSFFKQLEQLLPARADKLTGILIQPNLLERSKDTVLPTIKREDASYSIEIFDTSPTASGDYLQYVGNIANKILSISVIDDDQWQAYLTSPRAASKSGTTYSHDYLILSGSKYITGSSPYWSSEAELPVITSAVTSEFRFASKSILAQVQDYLPTGINNQRYNGSKLTSPGFNINSTQTVDGGPVVEYRKANPNQLMIQNGGTQGSFVLV